MAIAALLIGILAFLSSAAPFAGIVLGVVAIILGVLGRKRLVLEGRKTGAPVAGIVLGALALAGNTAMTVACLACSAAVATAEPTATTSSFLDAPAVTAPVAAAAASAAPGRIFRCDLSAGPARQCSEYHSSGGATEVGARETCDLVQLATPEGQRVALSEGPCPPANAIARCAQQLGGTTHVYYRDPDPMIDNAAAMGAMEAFCTGTFTRL
jgi:hypothetical protein